MAKMAIDDTSDHGEGGHRPSADAAWTAEQTVHALFLKAAAVRLEAIAIEIGIESHLVDRFVRDALFTVHHARHTLARGRQAEAWIEAIARNLGRTRRYGAAARGRRWALFWSLCPFARLVGIEEATPKADEQRPRRCPPDDDVTTFDRIDVPRERRLAADPLCIRKRLCGREITARREALPHASDTRRSS